jgi:diamine N-acetyltransferase
VSLSKEIFIRDVQASDHAVIFKWENDPKNWAVSERDKEYTFAEIKALIASAEDFKESNQKRWMISKKDKQLIGTIDVFQGDFRKGQVGIGILITDEADRKKGFAAQAVVQAINKCFADYFVDTFYADVHASNLASAALFIKCGFEPIHELDDNSNFDSQNSTIIRLKLCVKKLS